MTYSLKFLFKELIPPVLLKIWQRRRLYGYFGRYASWEDAQKITTGYDSDVILNTVKESLLKVKQGKAVYERDSVLFDQTYYPFPLLAGLLRIATSNQGRLSVLDFGGSLGSTYYQCKAFLAVLPELHWNVVEQENFVVCGKNYFEDEYLKFFDDIDTCLQTEHPDVIVLSSVVQYLPNPYAFLEKLMTYSFKHIIFDRTAFIETGGDRLTIQKVPPEIYPASYPAWFLNLERFLSILSSQYDLICEFNSPDQANIPSQFKGFFFARKVNDIS